MLAVVLAFAGSLLAILLTGPIVVRVEPVRVLARPSAERLRRSVERLAAEPGSVLVREGSVLGPRDPRSPERLHEVAIWIAGELSGSGFRPELLPYRLQEGTYWNVVARRPGRDPAAGTIVLGAHYDAYMDQRGANDNASGVAVLLELARTLPAHAPRAPLILAFFSTEEPPFFATDDMGSYRFARDLAAAGERIDVMIALDLVGYFSDAPGSQRFPHPWLRLLYPDRGNFIGVIGDARSGRPIEIVKRGMLSTAALPVESFRAPASLAPVHLSDHLSFRRLGFPAVLVTDTAFMRYPWYHTRQDTPDKLDYERMARVVTALHGVLGDATEPID